MKGSYCQCHYCKCEKGHVSCKGYGHEKGYGERRCLVIPSYGALLGKSYCYGGTEGEYCHCDYCKCESLIPYFKIKTYSLQVNMASARKDTRAAVGTTRSSQIWTESFISLETPNSFQIKLIIQINFVLIAEG